MIYMTELSGVLMSTKKMSKFMAESLECLQDAVRKEYEKKALLGLDVIVSRNGKACRIPAKEALKNAKS